ncbi:NAD(P)H-dependent oxidoreductase [Cryobacterium sp. CG_9.6]|uniref:FMN-dependent NADH-azoreductase n=1 Tax=Cryobacterium sp. CG_9.6 TaxID=2760710 RepID=UPI0024761CBD|nr:NAD(P)H-dependent oxidoreductase [Cryobacterium sp. CG_9.6]MDH6236710.1 FMN-dependent NADH-azoreductase [Cryobacterium sp. CG_9.6]
MKLLHIIASPRGQSNTLRISSAFLETLSGAVPDLAIHEIDLFNYNLPALAGDNIQAKYTLMMGQPIDKSHEASWRQIELLIADFLSADAYLVSSPMWNFSIPYALKYYIDCIVQPGYLFQYNELGHVVPLVNGKKMLCITSRGSDYSALSPMHAYDFQEPYLRAIFGFVGITALDFVNAEPMDMSPDWHASATTSAIELAKSIAVRSDWTADVTSAV